MRFVAMKQMLYVVRRFLAISLGLAVVGCGNSSTTNSNIPSPTAEDSEVAGEQIDPTTDPKVPNSLRQAWRQFFSTGAHKVASEADFRFTQAAKESFNPELYERYIRGPFVFGRFHPDGFWYDLVVIVVEADRNDDQRFGLLIFLSPSSEVERYQPVWVYKDRDLSRTRLSIASSRLYVSDYSEDGTVNTCILKWDKAKRVFICDGMDSRPSKKTARTKKASMDR